MAWANEEIAGLLREYAELTDHRGRRVRARNYEKAARSVAAGPTTSASSTSRRLRAIPGVGASIAAKIAEYRDTGSIRALEELRAKIPRGVLELTRVPGLGPKRALQLSHDLGVASVDDLAAAIKAGRLDGLAGFGAKSGERIASGIEVYRQGRERVLLDVALHTATTMVAALSAVSGCQRCAYAGSLRRMRETIGDVDILAAAQDSGPLMAAFAAQPEVAAVIASGPAKTSIRTDRGLQVDLRVVPTRRLGCGAAVLHRLDRAQRGGPPDRGAQEAQAVRVRPVRRREGGGEVGGTLIVSRTEEEVYARLGLAWVPPAMREDRGEIEAAMQGQIPSLVRENDLKGDLHTHTDLTDGVASLEVMVAAAERRGYEYYAITDHAPNLIMQRMTDEKMLAQRAQVRALDASLELLHGTELNIGPDGSVDWEAAGLGGQGLAGFDLCVASVHSHFEQPRAEMTRRFITACENPHVNIIGHPTARRIGKRPPVDVDLGELFRACARTGTALEINASPQRLDLPSDHIRAARDAGVKFAIDSDAHSVSDLGNMPYGVGAAQRGWLTPDDVINTWPLDKLRAFLRKGR